MQTIESYEIQQLDRKISAGDSAVLTVIFNMFSNEELRGFLDSLGHFFLFPLAGLLSSLKAVLAVRQAWLDKGKHGTALKAVIEVVTAAAVVTAVVGGLAAASIFATLSPIIFVAALGTKALYHTLSAPYYWVKSLLTKDTDKKQIYKNTAAAHAVGAIALSLATTAVALVLIAAKPLFAFLGVLGGAIAVGYSLHKAVTAKAPITQPAVTTNTVVPSSAAIIRDLGISRKPSLVVVTNNEAPQNTEIKTRKRGKSVSFFVEPASKQVEEAKEQVSSPLTSPALNA